MDNEKKGYVVTYTARSYLEIKGNIILKSLGNLYIHRALLESNNQKFKITFYTSLSDGDKAIEQTRLLVSKIERLINYKYNEQVLEQIHLFDSYYNDPDNLQVRSITTTQSRASPIIIKHIKDPLEIKEDLETNLSNYYSTYIDIYADLLKMNNGEGSFMMYYSLLYDLFGKQKSVDEYIVRQEPTVIMKKTTQPGSDFKETIYSYIRNQIGHLNNEGDVKWIREQVSHYLPRLKQLTRRAIK